MGHEISLPYSTNTRINIKKSFKRKSIVRSVDTEQQVTDNNNAKPLNVR